MRYIVAGGTGMIGRVLMPKLVQKAGVRNILCIVRATSDIRQLQGLGVETRTCDANEPDSCLVKIEPETTYLGIVTGSTNFSDTLEALRHSKISRAIFISNTQQDAGLADNEERIRRSGIPYLIMRPSMIYGSTPEKNSIQQLVRLVARWLVIPIPVTSDSLLQPVFADDLSRALLAALDNPQVANKEFTIAGPAPIQIREIIDTVADILGKRVALVNIPAKAATPIIRCLQHIPRFPLTALQLLHLRENRIFDIAPAAEELGYNPRSFADGVWLEIRKMRECGMIK